MNRILYYLKREKLYFYLSNLISLAVPFLFYRNRLAYWLQLRKKYPSKQIEDRLSYYISFNNPVNLPENESVLLQKFKRPKRDSMYFFDLIRYTKYFNKSYRIAYKFGDIVNNQEVPTIVKSRPINHTGNSVIMKLNGLRHFNFYEDTIPYSEKKDLIVWRGGLFQENRRNLVETFYNHPACDIGGVMNNDIYPSYWKKDYLSIREQLKYKFILSIEGNDVATNLKWVLNSNSLCFMPTPHFETWFMEGKLIPNVHYVLIKDDFSDLIEKRDYYLKNEVKAKEIIKNANAWTAQFKDSKLEKIFSLLVLDRYFEKTNQKIN